jgi:hypothetical protein
MATAVNTPKAIHSIDDSLEYAYKPEVHLRQPNAVLIMQPLRAKGEWWHFIPFGDDARHLHPSPCWHNAEGYSRPCWAG